ncbi:hypothetical protein A3Q56_07005 [Intoshia linei]|uniref:Protein SMG9 n=1 Tax=Intoshia linei TaxID=1819745 RepID=A0A177ATE7_9BILA|nr:hypothetical protein A3Q56_07005 [Intoshia linei]
MKNENTRPVMSKNIKILQRPDRLDEISNKSGDIAPRVLYKAEPKIEPKKRDINKWLNGNGNKNGRDYRINENGNQYIPPHRIAENRDKLDPYMLRQAGEILKIASKSQNIKPVNTSMGLKRSYKMIRASIDWCNDAVDNLSDVDADFTVVGLVGLQGVGKSTIASMLAGDDEQKNGIFITEKKIDIRSGDCTTKGINVYTTSNKLIILDSQPLMSASILNRSFHYEKKLRSDIFLHDNKVELQSIQLGIFMSSVCHVIFVVQDKLHDLKMLKYIKLVETLKSKFDLKYVTTTGCIKTKWVFVFNKINKNSLNNNVCSKIESTYQKFFSDHSYDVFGYFNNNLHVSVLNKSEKQRLNLFFLPSFYKKDTNTEPLASLFDQSLLKYDIEAHKYKPFVNSPNNDVPNDFVKCKEFFQQIEKLMYLVSMINPQHTKKLYTSEKSWFFYASGIWQSLKSHNYLRIYKRNLT